MKTGIALILLFSLAQIGSGSTECTGSGSIGGRCVLQADRRHRRQRTSRSFPRIFRVRN